ncbi:aldo-keto reductase [Fusarium albosuccineum]|uniref:Aldo-keto reductase n=1 Tax=Fusarium albosuccineum TaxID=1237068 RepID=A0A8H4PIH3_9HYPO|nr:aldo-keto reductase [Fusarium albosuccineum]
MSKTAVEKLLRVPESLSSSLASTKVGYRNLGNCGLRVSNLILGGLHMGSPKWLPWVLDEARALPLLKAAYDRGINTWDTANVYSNGQSERIMAKAISKFGIPRSKVILMTKCYRVICDPEQYDPGAEVTMHNDLADQSKDYVNQWGKWLPNHRASFALTIDNSLRAVSSRHL